MGGGVGVGVGEGVKVGVGGTDVGVKVVVGVGLRTVGVDVGAWVNSKEAHDVTTREKLRASIVRRFLTRCLICQTC